MAQFEGERHIVEDGHVRIERVVLKDHRDIAVFGRDIVDQTVADVEFTLRDVFEARNHAQRG